MHPRRKKIFLAVSCLAATVFTMFRPSDASQQDFYGGHLSVVDGSVSIQSAYDSELRTAEINLLVEEGTRIVTAPDGRAEVQLSGNDILRLWHDTEVDFIDVEGPVEMWMKLGSVYVRTAPERGEGYSQKIVTPTSTVSVARGTVLRIDVEHEERTRVRVLEGEAEVFSENDSVLLHPRQMATVGVARIYGPTGLSADRGDRFVEWCDERDELLGSPFYRRNAPEDVPVACDLDPYGSWVYAPDLRVRVWRPRVVVGWSPYRHGRWTWSLRYGWFWIAYEPWGWVPYHYGAWSWHSPWGWVWVPDRVWHGARVSWVVSGDYIGWRPLLYTSAHITVQVPAKHNRYCFVHRAAITGTHRNFLHLDEHHLQRHGTIAVKSPSSIIGPPNRVRKGPDRALVKGGHGERLAKQTPAVGRHAADHGTRPPRASGSPNRSFEQRLTERKTETRRHAKLEMAGHRPNGGATRIRPSERPAERTKAPSIRDGVSKQRNQAHAADLHSRHNPGFEVPKARSKPAHSQRLKEDRTKSPDHGSVSSKKPVRVSPVDRRASAGVSRSIRQPSRHDDSVQGRRHATERDSRPSKPGTSPKLSGHRGPR